MYTGKRLAPQRSGKVPAERSIQDRVIDACRERFTAQHPGGHAYRGIRIPDAGSIDLLLVPPEKGAMLVTARSSAHAAAFAHIIGQTIGDVAHLSSLDHHRSLELIAGTELVNTEDGRKLALRLQKDGADGDLGIVFAVGYEEYEGEDAIKRRLLPVIALLGRWAAAGVPGLRLGVHLWSIKLTATPQVVDASDLSSSPVSAAASPAPKKATPAKPAAPKAPAKKPAVKKK